MNRRGRGEAQRVQGTLYLSATSALLRDLRGFLPSTGMTITHWASNLMRGVGQRWEDPACST